MAGDFVLALLVLGGALWALLVHGARKDLEDADRKEAAARRAGETAREEARKYEPGTPLMCLNCEARFPGPLMPAGCPHCGRAGLVMTLAQLQAKGAKD